MTVVALQISEKKPYIYGQVAPFINNLLVSDVVATLLTSQSPGSRRGFCISIYPNN